MKVCYIRKIKIEKRKVESKEKCTPTTPLQFGAYLMKRTVRAGRGRRRKDTAAISLGPQDRSDKMTDWVGAKGGIGGVLIGGFLFQILMLSISGR